MTEIEVGRGFVHLNTPASITYTPGHKLSLSALRAKKSRVETVQLPIWMKEWRAAKAAFVTSHGLLPLATDGEEEREGEGPLYPPLVPAATAARRRRPFFTSLPDPKKKKEEEGVKERGEGSALDSFSFRAAGEEAVKGIQLVAHHKVSGEFTFTYPDYDGALSNGVVPEITVTPESEHAAAQRREYYVTPLDLTDEEAEALEELQMLWKTRSSSRSYSGVQMRAAVGESEKMHSSPLTRKSGTTTTSSTTFLDTTSFTAEEENSKKEKEHENNHKIGKRIPSGNELEDKEKNNSVMLSAFDEALRMADDLLQFS